MLHLTRRERFSAAHKLWNFNWSDEKNHETFGKCANPNWHGHNYELFVTIKGDLNEETGFVINLKLLSKILKEKVIVHLDHKNINVDCAFMKDKIATTENLAIGIWNQIAAPIAETGAALHCVKIAETENNFIEYFGNE